MVYVLVSIQAIEHYTGLGYPPGHDSKTLLLKTNLSKTKQNKTKPPTHPHTQRNQAGTNLDFIILEGTIYATGLGGGVIISLTQL